MPVNYHNNEEGNEWRCQDGAPGLGQNGDSDLFIFSCVASLHKVDLKKKNIKSVLFNV